jgi:hypothetical protein
MNSVIFYKPPKAAPAFGDKPIHSSTFRNSPITADSRQNWVAKQRSERDKTSKVVDCGLDRGEGLILERRAAGDDPARVQGVYTCYCCRGIGI